jgi:hypothetical protein
MDTIPMIFVAARFWYDSVDVDSLCLAEQRLHRGESPFAGYKDWEALDSAFEERAAIRQYDGDQTRYQAEQAAAQELGFTNKAKLKQAVQYLKVGNYDHT